MNIDVNITINYNDVVFSIPEFSIKKTIPGVILFNNKRDNILALGETEDTVKTSILSTMPNNTYENTSFVELPETHSMFQSLLNMSYDEVVQFCKKDPSNGPEVLWERLRENIDFVFPFSLEKPDYVYMALFINYHLILFTATENQGFLKSFLVSFIKKFSLFINFNEYPTLTLPKKNTLKKELSKALKAQIKIRELKINGEYT